MLRRYLQAFKTDERGAEAVESAIVLGTFLIALIGIFYLCITLWAYASLQYAVEEAARCYGVKKTVCASDSNVRDYAKNNYYGPQKAQTIFTPSTPTWGARSSVT